jgi:hypothetical protein
MTIKLYEAYLQTYRRLTPANQPVDYDKSQFKSPPQCLIQWFAYGLMYDEFSRELANSINELNEYIHRLRAWDEVTRGISEDELFHVSSDHITPIATLALNLPQVIRDRFMFAGAHLCHQANRVKLNEKWKDDLPLDYRINGSHFCNNAYHWSAYEIFKPAIDQISNDQYEKQTSYFRNSYNHRFSRKILVGQTNVVQRREQSPGKITYGIGGLPPLTLIEIINATSEKVKKCLAALQCFRKLVAEHNAAINSSFTTIGSQETG